MVRGSRRGIGKIAAAVALIVVVVVAVGIGAVLRSQGQGTTTQSTSSVHLSTSSTSETLSTSSSSSSSTTSSTLISTTSSTTSSSTMVGCTFSPPPALMANNSINPAPFTGCLTAGTTGVYLLGAADPHGMIMLGAVRAQYPINITIAGLRVGGLAAAQKTAFYSYNTTSVGFPDVLLGASVGYGIYIANLSSQNNTVVLTLNLEDLASVAG